MPRNAGFIVALFALILALFFGIYLGGQNAPLLEAESYAACAARMEGVIAGGQGDVYDYEGVTELIEPDLHYLAIYGVQGDRIVDPLLKPVPPRLGNQQKDSALQNEAWEIFIDLIPAQDRAMLAQYNVFTDGFGNVLAAVDQTPEDPALWILEIDIADLEDRSSLIFTLIHEYAHLLTLNASQVAPDEELVTDPYNLVLQTEKALLCPTYFTGLGCSRAGSYIHAFHARYWTEIEDAWERVDALQYSGAEPVVYYNALHEFYEAHTDRFLDDYSVTHPTEDIAEAFAYFVFSPQPAGLSLREQKIAFFYDYPELVRLRSDILTNLCSAFPQ